MDSDNKGLRPGDTIVLTIAPLGVLQGLAKCDQDAISEVVGTPVLLIACDDDKAELEFIDRDGVIHSIWADTRFLRRA